MVAQETHPDSCANFVQVTSYFFGTIIQTVLKYKWISEVLS
jgi:hypothetical protein